MIVVGVCGKKQAGKDTFADFGCNIVSDIGLSSAKIAIASPLKQFAIDYCGVDKSLPWGTDADKNKGIGQWGDFFNEGIVMGQGRLVDDTITVRELLQVLGTDVFRGIHKNWWINVLKSRINRGDFDQTEGSGDPAVVFVTDVRFLNEVEAINAMGGYTVKIDRDVFGDTHGSEASVDLIPEHKFAKIVRAEEIPTVNHVIPFVEESLRELGLYSGQQ
ncbi:MAG: hypothetical protein HOM01_15375 [Kordiimonadaceae bacterium]|jgi:hypothetical protein|nr:hypothetical protein [Kordiimonadaceae bacterium]